LARRVPARARRPSDSWLSATSRSTGDLRESVAAGTELGRKAKAAWMPVVFDDIVLGIIRERLQQTDAAVGFALDGFRAIWPRPLHWRRPRGIGQLLDAATHRRRHPDEATHAAAPLVTGKLLIYFSPKSELDACLKAGGELVQRADDNEETIGNRLKVYRAQTEPLVEHYQAAGLLRTINGQGSVDEVYQRIQQALKA
jgi:adenylate kinase